MPRINTATASDNLPRWHDGPDREADTWPGRDAPRVEPDVGDPLLPAWTRLPCECSEFGADPVKPARRHIDSMEHSFVRGLLVGVIGGLLVWAAVVMLWLSWGAR